MAAKKKKSGNSKSKTSENGSSTSKKGAAASSSSSSFFSWGAMVVAILALTLGVLTPQFIFKDTSTDSIKAATDASSSRAMDNVRALAQAKAPVRDPCTEEILQDFWHDERVPGFHIVCMERSSGEAIDQLVMTFYKEGTHKATPAKIPLPADWMGVRSIFQGVLGLPSPSVSDSPDERQPWAIFSKDGVRLIDGAEEEKEVGSFTDSLVTKFGLLLVYEGGQFVWPGVRLGYMRTTSLYSIMPEGSPDMGGKNRTITLETLSLYPLVLSVKGFLSEQECDRIQELATPSLEYSGVVLKDADQGRPASDFRTSQTTFLRSYDDPMMIDIDYRTASLVRIPRKHQENIQVLRYGKTEKYDAHHDFFEPSHYQKDPNTLRLIKNGARNRIATVFWYLSDVEEGGETVFPRFHGAHERTYQDCETGLLVKPQKGKVIIFYSLTADGKTDENSLHGACPVKKGIKWAANKWVWSEAMPYLPA